MCTQHWSCAHTDGGARLRAGGTTHLLADFTVASSNEEFGARLQRGAPADVAPVAAPSPLPAQQVGTWAERGPCRAERGQCHLSFRCGTAGTPRACAVH